MTYRNHFCNKNHALDKEVFDVSRASRVKQTHSSEVVMMDVPQRPDEWVEADAIVTRTPNLPIGVITADCVPILLSGDGVIGAAHAGWQGALNGVIDNTIAAMDCDPVTIQAHIGPAIGAQSYEVSKGFEAPFIACDLNAIQFFTEKNADKWLFDIKSYCADRLRKCGVTNITISEIDTLTHPDYHSHRGGAGAKDRNLSVIMING